MCGIVGIAGAITHLAKTQVFRDLLDVCQLRGRDSTGVIKVDKDLNYNWAKQVGPPTYLCDSRMYDHLERGDATVMIGHTRSKTVGEVSVKNAHPFDFPKEGICGVHNGTLRNISHLEGHSHQKVDSEVLYEHLAKYGALDTFNDIEGAWACVWWDANDKTLNFIRNKERPLWFTWSKDLKMMFWASEPSMFHAISRKIDLWDGGEDKRLFVELPENTLWSFRINPEAKANENTLTLRPIVAIEPKQVYLPQTGRYSGFGVTWRKNDASGEYERIPPVGKGGEVPHPFQLEKEVDALNDSLDVLRIPFLPKEKEGSAEEANSSLIANMSFLKQRLSGSVSSTPVNLSKSSNKNTLSLVPKTSTSTSPAVKEESCAGSPSKSTTSLVVKKTGTGVSFRNVTGMDYITDNVSGTEYNVNEFYKKTNGDCCFCKKDLTFDMTLVAEFITPEQVICEKCVSQPVALTSTK